MPLPTSSSPALTILVGMGLVIAVVLVRRFLVPRLDGPLVAWLTGLLPCLGALGVELATGAGWLEALSSAGQGLVAGLTAVGLYETAVRPVKASWKKKGRSSDVGRPWRSDT